MCCVALFCSFPFILTCLVSHFRDQREIVLLRGSKEEEDGWADLGWTVDKQERVSEAEELSRQVATSDHPGTSTEAQRTHEGVGHGEGEREGGEEKSKPTASQEGKQAQAQAQTPVEADVIFIHTCHGSSPALAIDN